MQIELDNKEIAFLLDVFNKTPGMINVMHARTIFDKLATAIEAEKDGDDEKR